MPFPPKHTRARLVFLFIKLGIFAGLGISTGLPGCMSQTRGVNPQSLKPENSPAVNVSRQPSGIRASQAPFGANSGEHPSTTSTPPETESLSPLPSGSHATVDDNRAPGTIVFACKPERYNQLCLMDPDGSDWTRLTNRQADDFHPALSPDGKTIVFVSDQSGRFEITLRSLATGLERQLTDGLGEVTSPEFSPDGQWVIFTNRLDGAEPSIWKMQVHGSLPRPLGNAGGSEFDPKWSPDGEQIAFAAEVGGYVELDLMDAEGNDSHKVYDGIVQIGGLGSWSPDGRSLAFYAGPRGDRDIYLLEIVTGRVKQITYGGNNSEPCFSPDGAWLAFSSSRDGDHEIFVMRVDGSEVTQLTDNRYDDWQPNWGP